MSAEAGLEEIRESRLQELEERVTELEERNRRPEPPKIKGTRRQFIGVMAFGAVAALLPGVTTAQTPSETAAQQYCVMQGPVEARPEPQEGCRWIYLEGDPDQPNSQVIRFTEGEAWHLFDVVPKNLYGRGYPDHPDYAGLSDTLNDVDTAVLGPETYGDVTTGSGQALLGAGFGTKIDALTLDIDSLAYFLALNEGATITDVRAKIQSCWSLSGAATHTINGGGSQWTNTTHLTDTINVEQPGCLVENSANAIGLTNTTVNINADNCVVAGNVFFDVTDNGTDNQVGLNTTA